MAGRSKVFDLSPELRAVLDKLLRDGVKLDDIVARLETMAEETGEAEDLPSRSAIHRYGQRLSKLTERARQSREIADRLVDAMGPQAADGKGIQALSQVMQSLVFETMGSVEEGQTFDSKSLMEMGRAIGSLASAQKTNADFVARVRAEALKDAAKAAEKTAKAKGLTTETVEEIMHAVLGV